MMQTNVWVQPLAGLRLTCLFAQNGLEHTAIVKRAP
jgi:hypothetical protein